jgi:hypothetical protein
LGTSSNGGLADNYNALSTANSSVSVTRRTLTATGNSNTVTYDGVTHSISGFSVLGLQGSDVPSDLSTIVATGASGLNAGTYTNQVSAGTEANYTVNTVNGSLVIDRRDISITGLTAADKAYDGNTSANITGASFDNVVAGDTLGLSGTGAFSDVAAGNNKTVTVYGVHLLGTDAANYRLAATSLTTFASIFALPTPTPQPQPGPTPAPAPAPAPGPTPSPGPFISVINPSLPNGGGGASSADAGSMAASLDNPFQLSTDTQGQCRLDNLDACGCDTAYPEPDLDICYQRFVSTP